MLISCLLLGFAVGGDQLVSDVITLRDGRVLLGQVAEAPPRVPLTVIVRRDWVEANLPDLRKKWQAVEAPKVRQARRERLQRLELWAKERVQANGADPVRAWVDQQRERLRQPFSERESPLMRVVVARGETRSTRPAPDNARRMLRQAWAHAIDGPESRTIDDMTRALREANVARVGEDDVGLEGLLPEPVETEGQWRSRRAATELVFDPGARFVRYESLLVPEGQEVGPEAAQKALGDLLGGLLGDPPQAANDPLAERLREVAAQGRVGALVTRLDGGPETAVEISLWVRDPRGNWSAALVRRASARADQVPPNAGDPLANDPQVQGAFAALEALGLGKLGEDAKRLSLRSGAAVEKALDAARTALRDDLKALVLPVRTGARPRDAQGEEGPGRE